MDPTNVMFQLGCGRFTERYFPLDSGSRLGDNILVERYGRNRKSTISRTVAQSRSQVGDLGASFFFKRGETDRGNVAKFKPSLAHQLALRAPGVAYLIKNAINDDPAIMGKFVGE